jgi:hypothetical protein
MLLVLVAAKVVNSLLLLLLRVLCVPLARSRPA